ncbi:MAG: AraC family transcriptional regulator [Planctomycetota bacterium]
MSAPLEESRRDHETFEQPARPDDALSESILRTGVWDGVTLIQRRHFGGEESVSAAEGTTDHMVLWNPDAVSFDRQRRDGHDYESSAPAGALNLVPAHEAFDWTWSYGGRPTTSYHVCLSPDLLARVAEEAGGIDPNRAHLKHGVNIQDPAIQQCVEMMHRELGEHGLGGWGGSLYIGSLARSLAVSLLRAYGTQDPRADSRPGQLNRRELDAVRDYVEAHLAEDVTLEELAGVTHLSVYHFTRKFKRTTGLTPHCYLMRRRVERAKALLKDRLFADRGIAPIAYACGFSDQSHLTRYFKRIVGVTPAQFRRGG